MAEPVSYSSLAGAAAAGMLMLLLGACARPVGDLGRAEPSLINDTLMPAAGALRAASVGEPVSRFSQSDEEKLMANRIWRFLTSGRTRDWFYDVTAELHRTRIAAAPVDGFGIDRYYNWLHSTRFQSSSVRYSTLADDVTADLSTVPETFAAICNVQEVERQRLSAAANLPDVGAAARGDVAARQAENDDQIGWFVRSLRYRYDSFNYALDHLLVETPDGAARAVDAALAGLGQDVGRAERDDFCGPSGMTARSRAEAPSIPSRFAVGGRASVATTPPGS